MLPILKKRGMASKIEEKALFKFWPQAVGQQINAQTRPDSFRNGILFVKTVSSVWGQQLHFVKQEIMEKLNRLSGNHPAVKDIRFIAGGRFPEIKRSVEKTFAGKPVLQKRDRDMIAECTDSLTDKELVALLQRVMRLEISRRRQLEQGKVR